MRHLNFRTQHIPGLIAALTLLALPAAGNTAYTVRPGDSAWSIAKQHHLSYLSILEANDLAEDAVLQPGQKLLLPGAAAAPTKASTTGGPSAQAEQVHVVREGESLWLVARRCGTTVRALAQANGLQPDRILRVGTRLKIPGAGDPQEHSSAAEEPTPRTHVVRPGQSLWVIARRYGTTVRALAHANGLRPDGVLRVGRRLIIPGHAGEAGAASSGQRPFAEIYIVKKGDSLWKIALRCGTTVRSLAAANGLRADRVLRIGTALQVPGDGAPPNGQHRFVQTALQYQGVRYRWGGLTTRGIDCSGLVVRVLRSHGIRAPHNSKALYKLGASVSRENLQPGDLVFFHTTRPGISHVGIYIGDGKFIHASSGKGRVRIDRIDRGYYQRRFVGAKRVA